MHITIVGAGYVGLVSGACFSEFGHDVICVDKNRDKIECLRKGRISIYEPGLNDIVARNVKAGRLAFSDDLASNSIDRDVVLIAVGTPSRRGDGHADLSYVYAAAEEIADQIRRPTVIVTKSTVPVGTAAKLEEIFAERLSSDLFDIVSNPEFLREGSAIEDFMRPDRVIVGANSERARSKLRELYRPLFLNRTPMVFTSWETAELTKYASNAFLATKITFINEIADLCEKVGADVQAVAKGMGLDQRIGPKFLHAGPGYGGSCFPKDALALLRTAESVGVELSIVDSVVRANDARKRAMSNKIADACGGSVDGKRIAILGLAFKPNTDDMRESPSLSIIAALMEMGAKVAAYDPICMEEAKKNLTDVTFCEGPYETLKNAEALVIITEWNEFRALDLEKAAKLMKSRVLVDLRNIYLPEEVMRHGFSYFSIGRRTPASCADHRPELEESEVTEVVQENLTAT